MFDQADTNGDGLISRAESSLLFPELTDAQFDDLDTNGDGFLSRAELGFGQSPGGCNPGDSSLGILAWLIAVLTALQNVVRRVYERMFDPHGGDSHQA